jgi:hypothetical protein
LVLVVGLGGAMCGAGAASAAELAEPSSPASPREDAIYRQTIRDGVGEYDSGHFEEARSLFRRAHEMNPSARTLRGIGMASFELRDYVVAVRSLAAALQDTRKPLLPEQRFGVQDLLERARMFVDVYRVKLSPRTTRLLVDGHAPEFEPDGTLLFGFGEHTLEASAPGMATRSESITIRGGARKDLELSLRPAAAAPARGARVPGLAKSASEAQTADRGAAWLWSSAGVALVAAAAGYYWYRQGSELASCRDPSAGVRCTNESTLSLQRNVAMGVALGGGAAALTMAVIGVLVRKPAAASTSTRYACAVGPHGIACGRTF